MPPLRACCDSHQDWITTSQPHYRDVGCPNYNLMPPSPEKYLVFWEKKPGIRGEIAVFDKSLVVFVVRVQTAICPMLCGVLAPNQIFLGGIPSQYKVSAYLRSPVSHRGMLWYHLVSTAYFMVHTYHLGTTVVSYVLLCKASVCSSMYPHGPVRHGMVWGQASHTESHWEESIRLSLHSTIRTALHSGLCCAP